jgi:hypothetical protein
LKILPFDPYQSATHRLHGPPQDPFSYPSLKGGVALLFDGTAATKLPLSVDLSEVPLKSPRFKHKSKPK